MQNFSGNCNSILCTFLASFTISFFTCRFLKSQPLAFKKVFLSRSRSGKQLEANIEETEHGAEKEEEVHCNWNIKVSQIETQISAYYLYFGASCPIPHQTRCINLYVLGP